MITQKSGSKLVYLLTLIGIQLKHTQRPAACHNTINHLSKHCQDEPQGYGTAHEAWHIWNSCADLLLPLAHLSADNGQEMWLFLTAGQRPMGYPVSRQDQIPSHVPLVVSDPPPPPPLPRSLSGFIMEVHLLHSCCRNTFAQMVHQQANWHWLGEISPTDDPLCTPAESPWFVLKATQHCAVQNNPRVREDVVFSFRRRSCLAVCLPI